MRKVRGWDSKNKRWVTDFFMSSNGGYIFVDNNEYYESQASVVGFEDCVNELKDITIVEFTGLVDNNGVDIWEGDLLQNKSGRICVVKRHKYIFFDCEPVKIVNHDNSDCFKPNLWKLLVKVGNIYESPELMKAIEGV